MQPSNTCAHLCITDRAALIDGARPGVTPALCRNDSHRAIPAAARVFHPKLSDDPGLSLAFVPQDGKVHRYGVTPDVDASTDVVR
jgi:hypothetical protein